MKKLKIMNPVFLDTETEAETNERALEILQCVEPILECQKPYWQKQIKVLFETYVKGSDDPVELAESKKNGLYWPFHRYIFYNMCAAYLKKGNENG